MKNYLKSSKWLRFVAAGAFSLMLVLNIMVSLEFDKDNFLPSITLIELGNKAMAQAEADGDDSGGWFWESYETDEPCTRQVCWLPGFLCDTFEGVRVRCVDGWSWCNDFCKI